VAQWQAKILAPQYNFDVKKTVVYGLYRFFVFSNFPYYSVLCVFVQCIKLAICQVLTNVKLVCEL